MSEIEEEFKETKYSRYYYKNLEKSRRKGRERMAHGRAKKALQNNNIMPTKAPKKKKTAMPTHNGGSEIDHTTPTHSRYTSPWSQSSPLPTTLDIDRILLPEHITDPALFDYHFTLDDVDGVTPQSGQNSFQDIINLDDETTAHWDSFSTLEGRVMDWLKEWGGLENWNTTMDMEFRQAQQDKVVSEWGEKVAEHHRRGAQLLQVLETFDGRLPREMWRIRHLWHNQCRVMLLLTRGMAFIEVRLNILNPGPFSMTYEVYNVQE
ncbi:hypothetical protein BDN72DRAFT_879901 [Pluteus cervinus]|uniref:Uncharacterized protein n=1 Tax=Pluteus cervinus TaxID=181527 RepID=A0ACD3AMC1_9AGAR|nr:hypothetical protein BDN72DRAFT_879901 [Pluteus cervinus]